MGYLQRVRSSVLGFMRTAWPERPAPDPVRTDIAEAAVRAIRRELPQELLGVVASADPSVGAALAERLHVPVRGPDEIVEQVCGAPLVVEGASAVEVRGVERHDDTARVRLRIHTATARHRRRASIITREMEVVVVRQRKRHWRLVSRRFLLIV